MKVLSWSNFSTIMQLTTLIGNVEPARSALFFPNSFGKLSEKPFLFMQTDVEFSSLHGCCKLCFNIESPSVCCSRKRIAAENILSTYSGCVKIRATLESGERRNMQ